MWRRRVALLPSFAVLGLHAQLAQEACHGTTLFIHGEPGGACCICLAGSRATITIQRLLSGTQKCQNVAQTPMAASAAGCKEASKSVSYIQVLYFLTATTPLEATKVPRSHSCKSVADRTFTTPPGQMDSSSDHTTTRARLASGKTTRSTRRADSSASRSLLAHLLKADFCSLPVLGGELRRSLKAEFLLPMLTVGCRRFTFTSLAMSAPFSGPAITGSLACGRALEMAIGLLIAGPATSKSTSPALPLKSEKRFAQRLSDDLL